MSGVELAFGIIGLTGAVDICYRYGKSFIKTCQAVAQADQRLRESGVRIEAIWLRIEVQLQVVGALEAELEERHRQIQGRTIEVLLAKLQVADAKLAGLVKTSSSSPPTIQPRRWKYGLAKDGLAAAITDLEDWLRLADTSWFFMIRFAAGSTVDRQLEVKAREKEAMPQSSADSPAPSIDMARQLRRATTSVDSSTKESVVLGPEGLHLDSISLVPLSPVIRARRLANNEAFLLDPVTSFPKAHASLSLKDARNFAWKLKNSNPFLLGLLDCKGVLKDSAGLFTTHKSGKKAEPSPGIFFVFRAPPVAQQKMESTRSRLLRGSESEHESLSGRFDLARQIVRAVSSVHLYDFVHKNVRPETILLLSSASVETAVLVGFDVLRNADGRTYHLGDDLWEKNLYRHPSRQGLTPEAYHEMRHDIYSVGVCLLEIGLWQSFVSYGGGGNPEVPGWLARDMELDGASNSGGELMKSPEAVKSCLLRLARGRLRRTMGTKYSKIVETCLTCLDENNEDFGDEKEFHDDDGVAVGARYIEKVVEQLAEISV